MNKPSAKSVATMQGRELDAAVHERVFGKAVKCLHQKTTRPNPKSSLRVCDGRGESFGSTTYAMALDAWPHYSTDPAAFFFEMVEKVQADGWGVRIDGAGREWMVELWHETKLLVRQWGSTLPLAFARAALLTTLTPES